MIFATYKNGQFLLFTIGFVSSFLSADAFQPSRSICYFTPLSLFDNSMTCANDINKLHKRMCMVSGDKTDVDDKGNSTNIPPCIKSPVLISLYPALVAHKAEYGNPNIPLGNADGRRCKTLRRLAFQNDLTDDEMNLLTEIGFRFNSLEDVYEEADFDQCLQRLLEYEEENKTNYQIPKKYKPDPELGAWVTMIRRIGRDKIEPSRREKLDKIQFAWVSTRKCGSNFMKNFRPLKENLENCCQLNEDGVWDIVDQEGLDEVLSGEGVMKWVKSQKAAAENGLLSEARCEYLDQLPGLNWRK